MCAPNCLLYPVSPCCWFCCVLSLCVSLTLGKYTKQQKQARILKETGVADEARRQFRTTRDKTDPLMLRAAISEAEWYLESMMQSSKKHGLAGDPGRSNKGGSWMDVDDPGDERGRVGEGFPWER